MAVAGTAGAGRGKGGRPHYGANYGKDPPSLAEGAWTEGVIVNYTPNHRGWVQTDDNQGDIYFDHRALPAELRARPLNNLFVTCQVWYRKDEGGSL